MNWYTNAHTNVSFTHTHPIHKHVHSHTTMHHTYIHITMSTQLGFFPLYVASQKDHDRIVETLLQAGATVDLQNKVENHVNCSVMYSTLSIPHNIPGQIKFREHFQQITSTDMHGRTHLCTGSMYGT